MTKLDLIEDLKNKAGISKREAASVVDMFFGKMFPYRANKKRRGFCKFLPSFLKQVLLVSYFLH